MLRAPPQPDCRALHSPLAPLPALPAGGGGGGNPSVGGGGLAVRAGALARASNSYKFNI
jgi:hypothetical protein